MHPKKGVLKGWHKGTHAHHISPLRETRDLQHGKGMGVKRWAEGGIELYAGKWEEVNWLLDSLQSKGVVDLMAHTSMNEPNPSVVLALMCDL